MGKKLNGINRIIVIILFINMLMINYSCEVFFEEDIENKSVALLAPADSLSSEILTHTFWWKTIKGASDYRLQIVLPDFETVSILLIDTLVNGDKFEHTLYPGSFQWRVRAENSAYVSNWSIASLTIFDSDDLTRQKVVLSSPKDNFFTASNTVSLNWEPLNNSDSYNLQIFTEGWGQTLEKDSSDIIDDNADIALAEGEYWWGIQAVNDISQTTFSVQRIVIDQTSPNEPELLFPDDNVTLSDTIVTFSWNSSDPIWDTVKDSLFIYERIGQSDQLIHQNIYSLKNASIELSANKTYVWYVISVDQAGNSGNPSNVQTFSVVE